jgi:hypothetical protein
MLVRILLKWFDGRMEVKKRGRTRRTAMALLHARCGVSESIFKAKMTREGILASAFQGSISCLVIVEDGLVRLLFVILA